MEALLPISMIALVFVIYAFADFISVKTKSIVSMLFTSSVIFLIVFWLGLPPDAIPTTGMVTIGGNFMVVLLTHMGTLLNIQQLREQWRTVLVAIASILGIAIFLFVVGTPFIGRETAIVAAPPISGGIIAGMQMGKAAEAIGRSDLMVLATLLVSVQGFLGYPIASFCLQKVARRTLAENKNKKKVEKTQGGESEKPKLIPPVPEKYMGVNLLLAKVSVVALLASVASFYLTKWTGLPIFDKNILALIFGIIGAETGFLERDILTKANSFGFTIAALLLVIFQGLSKATPEIVLGLLPKMVASLVFGVIGIALASFIMGKILKMDFMMAFAVGVSALFGFPGTFIVSNEVASSVAKNSEEKQIILDEILPKMLVAGFITVSIASVVLAGIMAGFLK